MNSFADFFKQATCHDPFPYQEILSESECLPSRLSIPTGLGKTAAVILAWIWRRRFAEDVIRCQTPRRLVYCLPMRVLVEQTRAQTEAWLTALGLPIEKSQAGEGISVHVLLGGEADRDWDVSPERDTIIIGTQDMLLSRALNRGYAMSRFRWPVQFGLINNDCLWVMDEIQLMGDGLATTTQLQALRRKLGVFGNTRSLWMSATMRSDWLETVDFQIDLDAPGELSLSKADHAKPEVKKRLAAKKVVKRAPVSWTQEANEEATFTLEKHRKDHLTLVVVNTVARARRLHSNLCRAKTSANLVLIHSHFRPADKSRQLELLLNRPGAEGTIAVATQVVEAGVDVSSAVLVTDLAPWSSLVQRFGRCNRFGELPIGEVFWIDINDEVKGKYPFAPYGADDLDIARETLNGLTDAAPDRLPPTKSSMPFAHVLRRRDLIDLFDTTPDLAGADIDVSRFIRESSAHNVQVFFRDIPSDAEPADDEPAPRSEELCNTGIGEIRGLIKEKRNAWAWDHLERRWIRRTQVYPGQVLMMRATDGGYHEKFGFTGDRGHIPSVLNALNAFPDANDDDRWSERRQWATIAEHTRAVCKTLDEIITALEYLPYDLLEELRLACLWHDRGKAHPVFQNAMLSSASAPPREAIWAKTSIGSIRYERPGFRHELASGLALLQEGGTPLAAYLAAAHHGKVRLSIRSLPIEVRPAEKGLRFARGIWDGDRLPSTDLGDVIAPEVELNLAAMEIGDGPDGRSWLARMLDLRDDLQIGPLRLAYLEALLRAADWRASGQPMAPAMALEDSSSEVAM